MYYLKGKTSDEKLYTFLGKNVKAQLDYFDVSYKFFADFFNGTLQVGGTNRKRIKDEFFSKKEILENKFCEEIRNVFNIENKVVVDFEKDYFHIEFENKDEAVKFKLKHNLNLEKTNGI